MKEAAGEANMTVITIILIGLVMAAGAILIPQLLTSMAKRSACTDAGGTLTGNTCRNNSNQVICNLTKNTSGEWVCQ